ncbi:MAG: M48 family metallopeptidase [Desulfocucumaceae bacterium]
MKTATKATYSGTISLGGREVEYSVRQSKRAKYLRLKINIDTGLEVILPEGFKTSQLEHHLRSKELWLTAKLDYMDRLKEKRREQAAIKGRQALYMGSEYDIVTIVRPGSKARVNLLDNRIFATVPDDSPETLEKALIGWYHKQAAIVFTDRAQLIGSRLNLKHSRISIRSQKTRWGSCSRQGNLSFNWRVIMAPSQVIDYLLIHELAHLKEMNHSKAFWSLVESIDPDYKKHRQWLKENGHLLVI